VNAEEPFFQASLTPEIAVHKRTEFIKGITLSVWGENPQTSAAFGFINGFAGDSTGASFGLLNYSIGGYTGAQFSYFNSAMNMHGAQFGLVNHAKDADYGFQFGFINIIESNKQWFKDFPYSLAPVMIFVNWRIKR
jgi:hypothetical protein